MKMICQIKENICNKIHILTQNREAKTLGFTRVSVTEEVVKKYKNTVKGNKDKSDLEVVKKINRNFYSGQQIYKDDDIITRAYGCLHIKYDRLTNEIYDIINYKCYSDVKMGRINEELKEKLNELYRIKEEK